MSLWQISVSYCFPLSLLPPSPHTHTHKTNLENHPWTGELLWKSTSQKWHSNPPMQKQNVRLETLKKIKGIVLLYLHYPSLKAAELISNKVFLGPKLLPWGNVKAHEWAPGFPSCTGPCQRDQLLSCSIQNTDLWTTGLQGRELLEDSSHRSEQNITKMHGPSVKCWVLT